MNGNFKVGEVLVGQNFVIDTHLNGMECTVFSGAVYNYSWVNDGLGYDLDWADGSQSWQTAFHLRRKQPPSGELSILNMFVVAPPQRTKEIA